MLRVLGFLLILAAAMTILWAPFVSPSAVSATDRSSELVASEPPPSDSAADAEDSPSDRDRAEEAADDVEELTESGQLLAAHCRPAHALTRSAQRVGRVEQLDTPPPKG